jgi:hypothetical protein
VAVQLVVFGDAVIDDTRHERVVASLRGASAGIDPDARPAAEDIRGARRLGGFGYRLADRNAAVE